MLAERTTTMAEKMSSPKSPKIKKILGRWKSSHYVYYLVKWEDGYADTWERTDEVNRQKGIVDDWRSWIKERNLAVQNKKRGSFRPEAASTTAKHGLTDTMKKYVFPADKAKRKLNFKSVAKTDKPKAEENKGVGKLKQQKAGKTVKAPVQSKESSTKTHNTNEKSKVKVVSKPKNVKSAASKINAARTKAVKMLTLKKTGGKLPKPKVSKRVSAKTAKSKPKKENKDSKAAKQHNSLVKSKDIKSQNATKKPDEVRMTTRNSPNSKGVARNASSKGETNNSPNRTKSKDEKTTLMKIQSDSTLDKKQRRSLTLKSLSDGKVSGGKTAAQINGELRRVSRSKLNGKTENLGDCNKKTTGAKRVNNKTTNPRKITKYGSDSRLAKRAAEKLLANSKSNLSPKNKNNANTKNSKITTFVKSESNNNFENTPGSKSYGDQNVSCSPKNKGNTNTRNDKITTLAKSESDDNSKNSSVSKSSVDSKVTRSPKNKGNVDTKNGKITKQAKSESNDNSKSTPISKSSGVSKVTRSPKNKDNVDTKNGKTTALVISENSDNSKNTPDSKSSGDSKVSRSPKNKDNTNTKNSKITTWFETKNSLGSKNNATVSRKRPGAPLAVDCLQQPLVKKIKEEKEDGSVCSTDQEVASIPVNMSETDNDTDSEILYSLGTSVARNKAAAKKKLSLKLFDIRSSGNSECSTPESDLEFTMKGLTKDRGVSMTAKSALKSESANSPMTCLVCGDRAFYVHYGAVSCDSCRAFFKRTVFQRVQHKLCFDNCSVTVTNRRCSYCRFKKCISVGMGESVQDMKNVLRQLQPELMEMTPPSHGNSPYKTPPRTPEADTEPAQGDMLDSIPDIPVMPMLPNSPAASHRNFMKRLKTLEADRGIKRSEGAEIERRTSVRQSESAFRYKEIVVKKSMGFTQIWLFTSTTKMKNALSLDVINELKQALENARKDDSKLIMLSGQGSVFCSGVDLECVTTGQQVQLVNSIKEFTNLMISYPKPIVAVVNGPAIGYGTAFLPLCDIVYASDKATFHCPYSRLNQTPEACSSFTFPQVMGAAMANEMLLAGRKLTALEAHQAGLVSQVFWPTSMMQEVVPRLQQMARNSAKALEASKLLIRSHQKAKLEFTNETECQLLDERWRSAQTIKAVESYLREEKDV